MLDDIIKNTEHDLSRKAKWDTRFADIEVINKDLRRGDVNDLSQTDISQKLDDISEMLNKKDITRRIQESYRHDSNNDRDWFNEYKTVVEMYERKKRVKEGKSQRVNPHDISLRALDSILEGDIYKTYSKRFEMAGEAINKIGQEIEDLRQKGHEKTANELSYKLVTKVSNYIGQNENLDRKEGLPDIENYALDSVKDENIKQKIIRQAQEGRFDRRGNMSKRARREAQRRADRMRGKWEYDVSDQNETNGSSESEGTNQQQEKKIINPEVVHEGGDTSSSQEKNQKSEYESGEIIDVEGYSTDPQKNTKRRSWFKRKSMGIVAAGLLALVGGGVYLANHLTDQDWFNTSIEEEQSVNDQFTYSFSPVEKYGEIEENVLREVGAIRTSDDYRLTPRKKEISEFGDELVNRVKNTLKSEYDIEGDVSEFMNIVNSEEKVYSDFLMGVIAEELQEMTGSFSEEGLLLRGIGNDYKKDEAINPDFDLSTFYFLHVCKELGINAHPRMNNNDLYLSVKNHSGGEFVYEPENFSVVGEKGKGFYSSLSEQKEKSEDIESEIGLHKDMSGEELKSYMRSNILESVLNYAKEKGDKELENETVKYLEDTLKEEEPIYIASHNFYGHHVRELMDAIGARDYEDARYHLDKAKWVRDLDPGAFSGEEEPKFKVLEAKVLYGEGDYDSLEDCEPFKDCLEELNDYYGDREDHDASMGNGFALNERHAGVLLMRAMVEDMPKNWKRAMFYEPAMNSLAGYDNSEALYGDLIKDARKECGVD